MIADADPRAIVAALYGGTFGDPALGGGRPLAGGACACDDLDRCSASVAKFALRRQ